MNPNSTEPGPLLLTKDVIKPVRTGSLPFKKRFSLPFKVESSGLTKTKTEGGHGLLKFPLNSSKKDPKMNTDTIISAERMAALAMVAEAAGPSAKHGFSSYGDNDGGHKKSPTDVSAVSSITDVLVIAAAELEEDGWTGSKMPVTSQQHHHDGPDPNGCHGKTSRNNAYCRRQPGYKGSKYCKLHYQHYVLAGRGDAAEKTTSSPSSLNSSSDASPTLIQHQDKRYTGSPTDIRCKGAPMLLLPRAH